MQETADQPPREPDGARIRDLIRQRHRLERAGDSAEEIAEIDVELERLGVQRVAAPGTRGPDEGPALPGT